MEYELLTNLFFALVPIALFAIGVAWGLNRKDAQESITIQDKEKKKEKLDKQSKNFYDEQNKKNNKAQTISENLDQERQDIDKKYMDLAKEAASPIAINERIQKLDRDEKSLNNRLTSLIDETHEQKELAIEGATRNAPFQYEPGSNGFSKKVSAAILVLGLLVGGCSSSGGGEQPNSQFVYEIVGVDVTGSYEGETTNITHHLSLPVSSQISADKHKVKGTFINNRRVQEHFTDSIDYPKSFWDRKDRERIEAQKAYPIRINQRWTQLLEGIDKNLGESYLFPSMKINCNELARSGADVKILHLYSDMLPSSPAFQIADYVHNPKEIFKNGKAEKIFERIDGHFYEHPYEDWTGVKIIVHYNPPKGKDELFAAVMQLFKIWVESHNGRIVHQSS